MISCSCEIMTFPPASRWIAGSARRGGLSLVPWLVLLGGVVLAAGGSPAPPPRELFGPYPSPDELARQAYQVLKANCFECHGASKRGGLDMRTPATLKAGGAKGPVIVAHDPDKSRLYLYAAYEQDVKMPPPPRGRITDAELDTLRAWIEAGGSLEGVDDAQAAARSAEELRRSEDRPIRPQERQYWAFQTPVRAAPPTVKTPGWSDHPIDAFLAARMEAKGVAPSGPADRRTLIRRAYLDVIGLPPSPEEVDAFVADKTPGAWETVVDRLLASPHYGERWARHWMDLVRYADSGGFEFDVDRTEMYRYRDYLVRSFNSDKPYDRFIREQLAGDEYPPITEEAMIATGFLRLGPSGGGNRQDALDDLLSTTSLTFMGLTVGCARCHNHKFDPIPQKDYYRLQSVFFSTRDVDYPLAPAHQVENNRLESERFTARQKPLRDAKKAIEAPYLQQILDREIARLPEYMQLAWKTPPDQRSEGQKLNVIQIERTITNDSLRALVTEKDIVALMPAEVKAKHDEVKAKLAALDAEKPKPLPTALTIGERGRVPQPSFFLHRGSPDAPGSQMTPGVLSVVSEEEWPFPEPPADATSSWRRRGLAEWLTWKGNPLTARVMVNRLWQHHFGEGIARNPGNFGKMGEQPSHPELLDWLAVELVDRGWSLKAMHRLMLTSRAYQMSSADMAANVAVDPENRLFWRAPRVRLEGEIIRDAMLAVAGTLDRTIGGPSIFPYIDPDLFEESSKRTWRGAPDDDPSTWRRSLYVFLKRSIHYPMFETFDQPNLVNSADRRNRTTIAPQALILMNNGMVLTQAKRLAARLVREAGADVGAQVDRGFRLALARLPDADERQRSIAFVKSGPAGLTEFCHALFNLNEFVYSQ
jgi:mono/diheme cytochrome c family protein